MEKPKISLLLADASNEYQQMLLADAGRAAEAAGLTLESDFANNQITVQIRQLYGFINRDPTRRTRAIIVLPVRDNSLNRVASDAAKAGVGWVCLHRKMDYIDELRQEYPGLTFATVGPDQLEIGRIQARQFRAILPRGGHALYVKGNLANSSAEMRLSGMLEQIEGSGVDTRDTLSGNWTTDDAQRVVEGWLRMVLSGSSRLDLIGCQNDAMAVGARSALESVASYLRRPEIARIPVTGCDGLPGRGQQLVNEGKLAATIVVPSSGGAAVQLVARALQQKQKPPRDVLLQCSSYPDEITLAGRFKAAS
jgi:ABC-type sugar transport system substrate-binding protein